MLTVNQNSFGLWFVYLNSDPIAGGYTTEQQALDEMERFK